MLFELYLLLVIVTLACTALALFKIPGPWSTMSMVFLFALAVGATGLESRTCGVCQSTYTNLTIAADTAQGPVIQSYSVPTGSPFELLAWVDAHNDDFNITGWEMSPFDCEIVCDTEIYSDQGLFAVWAGLGFIMLYIVMKQRSDEAIKDKNNPWYNWR